MIDIHKRFLIVGLGLIGGSYARGLSKCGYLVDAIDKNPDSLAYAKEQGIISRETLTDIQKVQRADYIILSLYPSAMVGWVQEYQQYFAPGVLLTDVSGVKRPVVPAIQAILREDAEFIGSHPMAGKEVSGVEHSDERIFHIANFIITPTQQNTQRALSFVHDLAEILQFHKIVTLSIEEHDEMIGFVSQLTHGIAVSLMNCCDDPDLKNYVGDSFRDLTRIANINETLWTELFFLNRDVLISQIDGFLAMMDRLKQALVQKDSGALGELFWTSTQRRKHFDEP